MNSKGKAAGSRNVVPNLFTIRQDKIVALFRDIDNRSDHASQ